MIAAMIIVLFISPYFGYTQSESKNTIEEKTLQENWKKAKGTFQFQVINSRLQPQIHISILETIQANRKLNEDVYLPYKDNIRIYIPSTKEIESVEFEKLELIKYINISE